MPNTEEQARWGHYTRRANEILERARHDLFEPSLMSAMQALADELDIAGNATSELSARIDPALRQARATAHLAAGEAWLALGDNQRSLDQFDSARGCLDDQSPAIKEIAWLFAQVQCGKGRSLQALQQPVASLAVLDVAIDLCYRHGEPSEEQQQSVLAQILHTIGMAHSDLGEHAQALQAVARAVDIRRSLVNRNIDRHRLALSRSLRNLGNEMATLGRDDEAMQAWREMLALRQEQWRHAPTVAATLALAQAEDTVVRALVARARDEPATTTALAVDAATHWLTLVQAYKSRFESSFDRQIEFLAFYANALAVLDQPEHSDRLLDVALDLARTSGNESERVHLPGIAEARFNRGCHLASIGRPILALEAYETAVRQFRTLARSDRLRVLPGLGRSLNNLGLTLNELGRREESLAAAHEAVAVNRELVAHDRTAHLPALAESLHNLGDAHDRARQYDAALRASQEAVELARELVAHDRSGHLISLARSVNNLTHRLEDLGLRQEARETAQEAVHLARELTAHDRGRHLRYLSVTLVNLSIRLADAKEPISAVAAIDEAIGYYHELRIPEGSQFYIDYVAALLHCGMRHREAGLEGRGESVLREAAALLLRCPPTNPYDWCAMAEGPTRFLGTLDDLHAWHLPLVQQFTEHRELAWDYAHADVFLRNHRRLAARVWEILSTRADISHEQLDSAGATLAGAMQSPDLARWLETRRLEGDAFAALTELKLRVIEAEQRLHDWRAHPPESDQGSLRAAVSRTVFDGSASTVDGSDRQVAEIRSLRQAFRNERARLAREHPSFAATFGLPDIGALRAAASHAGADALLCLLELDGTDDRRVVGILFHADGSPSERIELPGLHELSRSASTDDPATLVGNRRGPLRGHRHDAALEVPARSSEDLAPELRNMLTGLIGEMFWKPLQRAIESSGRVVRRMHLCPHGVTQQLPLARRRDHDCPDVEIIGWPGLPYLRLAASLAPNRTSNRDATSASPWFVGHDCAWQSDQPLPMVAVEAALLRDLLQRHGHVVQTIDDATHLQGGAAALVVCCHGGTEQVQFDHALHLGREPLTVRQILQERLGPPLALLPACHAGRTDEDAAGNALGVAAAFMLSGASVVVGSSKAVPDLLQPWMSTLMVWHVVQGLPHHRAATLAREQFARLAFPEGYRDWLQRALPQALATIQPGGEEDPRITGIRAQAAIDNVAAFWPWDGDTRHLFSPDRALRDDATRSVVHGILRTRSEIDSARDVAFAAQEMAAFTFIYGMDVR